MDFHKRNEVIEQSMHFVEREAERLCRRLPSSVDVDDLVNDGVIGLMEALDRFDPQKATLRTFAARRIRGAMLDGLRSRDPISRTTRRSIRNMEMAVDRTRQGTGRADCRRFRARYPPARSRAGAGAKGTAR